MQLATQIFYDLTLTLGKSPAALFPVAPFVGFPFSNLGFELFPDLVDFVISEGRHNFKGMCE